MLRFLLLLALALAAASLSAWAFLRLLAATIGRHGGSAEHFRRFFVMAFWALAAWAVFVVVSLVAAAAQPVHPFKSDGCSGGLSAFYRTVLRKPPPYEHCCRDHDRAYWAGGTADERRMADRKLMTCMRAAGVSRAAATVVWGAVRVGGTPFMPFDWRWGFGHDYGTTEFYERPGRAKN